MRKDATWGHGANSARWCSLPESEMRAVLVVVADVFREQSLQMAFVHCNDVVQQVTAATLDPSLRDAILPRTFEGGSHRPDLQRSNDCGNLHSILAIPVEDEKPGSRFKRKRFPQLLHDPQARRMLGDVEVQNASTVVTDDEEAVEHTEGNRWNGEEVHRRDGFPMIAQKGEPAFGRFGISRCSFHPARDRSLGNIETEHEKLAVDARRSPSWILGHHAKDQFPNFLRSLSSSDRPSHSGNQFPIQPETSPMPSDHRFRGNDDKRLSPSGPEPSRQNPEELVEYCESWPGMPSFQCRELLTKSEVFNQEAATCVEEAKNGAEQESKGLCHAGLLSRFACGTQRYILLKSQADRILANDRAKD